jgi:hypothetical protein
MQILVILSLAVVGLFAVRYAVQKFMAWRARSQAMHLHGCKPLRELPHTDPILGLDRARRLKKAQEDGRALTAAGEDFAAYGKTFKSSTLGMTTIHTMEWANIHAVQSIEFDKWGVEPLRQSVSAMMGNGITVSDGAAWSHARKTLRPVFKKAQLDDLEEKASEKHLSRIFRRIPNDGSIIDLQLLFQRRVGAKLSLIGMEAAKHYLSVHQRITGIYFR